MRCRPNELCMVISEMRGCECNIGAFLTVEELIIEEGHPPSWTFKEASRPLKVLWQDLFVSHSYEAPPGRYIMRDCDLMPIRPYELEEDEVESVIESF